VPLPVPGSGRPGEDPFPALVEEAPRGVGEDIDGLPALPAGIEPAFLAHAGGDHPDRALGNVEAVHQRDQSTQSGLAAPVAQIVTEKVEDQRPRFHKHLLGPLRALPLYVSTS
jgi:hypothetical protein